MKVKNVVYFHREIRTNPLWLLELALCFLNASLIGFLVLAINDKQQLMKVYSVFTVQ